MTQDPDSTDPPAIVQTFLALASETRLTILRWLGNPRAHFPEHPYSDLAMDGVCARSIAEKLGISRPDLEAHMALLVGCGLVRAKRIRKGTFYAREDVAITAIARALDRLR